MTPGSDHFLAELFRGTQGPIYFCVLRNNKSKLQSGEVAHIITRDLNKIEGFRDKWDRPEHECGIYFHTATLKPGATQRNKETCFQFTAIFADIDDKNHLLSDRANVLELLDDCACPPSIVVDSGHGLQAHWLFNQPCADLDRVVTLRKKLRGLTASDPVHDAPRVMRLPGTHNSKGGDWIEAVVVTQSPNSKRGLPLSKSLSPARRNRSRSRKRSRSTTAGRRASTTTFPISLLSARHFVSFLMTIGRSGATWDLRCTLNLATLGARCGMNGVPRARSTKRKIRTVLGHTSTQAAASP